MLFNILVAIFVGLFIAIVALGHVLLAAAIWPNVLDRTPEPQVDADEPLPAPLPTLHAENLVS